MSAVETVTTLPRWLWSKDHACVVEVVRTGHFPLSVMAKMPDGRTVEMDVSSLEIPSAVTEPKL